ncbi:unnamed protein product [Rotaria socialis]
MSRPRFLSCLLGVYENLISHHDDKMIILVHWCFLNKYFCVIEDGKEKDIFTFKRDGPSGIFNTRSNSQQLEANFTHRLVLKNKSCERQWSIR